MCPIGSLKIITDNDSYEILLSFYHLVKNQTRIDVVLTERGGVRKQNERDVREYLTGKLLSTKHDKDARHHPFEFYVDGKKNHLDLFVEDGDLSEQISYLECRPKIQLILTTANGT
ncbi:MAG: hypothetical protein KW804_03360 [Candidatus Doudnabacteria bacterium]|nr:hypothetical protein [Candidatus Doudnabacteria bacterium]